LREPTSPDDGPEWLLDLMKEAAALESAVVGDVMRSSTGSSVTRQLIVDRLHSCQLGILDGRGTLR
jgi:hypothetical protein